MHPKGAKGPGIATRHGWGLGTVIPWRRSSAVLEFGGQVGELVAELAIGDLDGCNFELGNVDPVTVEIVAASSRVPADCVQVGSEGAVGKGMCVEAFELRVITVSSCSAADHLLREKRFLPQVD